MSTDVPRNGAIQNLCCLRKCNIGRTLAGCPLAFMARNEPGKRIVPMMLPPMLSFLVYPRHLKPNFMLFAFGTS